MTLRSSNCNFTAQVYEPSEVFIFFKNDILVKTILYGQNLLALSLCLYCIWRFNETPCHL